MLFNTFQYRMKIDENLVTRKELQLEKYSVVSTD